MKAMPALYTLGVNLDTAAAKAQDLAAEQLPGRAVIPLILSHQFFFVKVRQQVVLGLKAEQSEGR